MAKLYVDLYFRGMMKMVLEETETSFFRGINRVAQEYARRLPKNSAFEDTHLFGSRLPSLTYGSFKMAGLRNDFHHPSKPWLRERILSVVNSLDRQWSRRFPKAMIKLPKFVGAVSRNLAVIGMNRELFVPVVPQSGDLWLAVCSTLTPSIRELPTKRVIVCYDFDHIYHYRELGLSEPCANANSNPAIDARKDEWIICISDYTRRCFLKYHPTFPPSRVFVVPLGADLRPELKAASAESVLKRWNLGTGRYFLTLSAGSPHKNSAYLIEEFVAWRKAGTAKSEGVKLILVGSGQDYLMGELSVEAKLAVRDGTVIFTGYLEDRQLPALYEHAMAFLFASLAEGFGLPPLEAMMYGTPVVCSDRTSLPEVVGDAGLLFNPTVPGELAKCLDLISSNVALQSRLGSLGKQRAQEFTWDRSAEKLLKVLEEISAMDISGRD